MKQSIDARMTGTTTARYLTVSILFILAFLLLTRLSQAFTVASGVMVWYAPVGLNIALLLIFGVQYLPAIVVAGFFGGKLLLLPDAPLLPLVIVSVTTPILEAAALHLLQRVTQRHWQRWTLHEFGIFMTVMLMMPLFAAVAGITNYAFFDLIPWSVFAAICFHWWIGDVIGLFTVMPLLVFTVYPMIQAISRRQKSPLPSLAALITFISDKRRLWVMILGHTLSIFLVLWICFLSPLSAQFDLFYLCFLPLLWLVFSYGLSGAAWGIASLNLGATLLVQQSAEMAGVANLQLFLMMLSLTGLFLGKLVSERQQMEQAIKASETKYRVLFESFPLGITVSDPSGKIVETNVIAEDILGLPRKEQEHRTLDDQAWRIIRPDGTPVPPAEFAALRALRENRVISHAEMGFVKTDDRITWLDVTAAPIPLEQYGVVVTYSDITTSKKTEERNCFQAHLLDSVQQAVIATEPDGTIIYWNACAETLYGWSAKEAVGRNIMQVTVPQTTTEQAQEIMATLANGQSWHGEFLVQCKDGSTFPAEVTDSPVYNAEGELEAIIGISADITERKRAEDELRCLQEQLQQENVYLQEEIRLDHNFDKIIGNSEALRYMLFRVEQIASSNTTVLIVGETGTGKELVARAIHHTSPRKERPLIKVNCAALPGDLIESELFGHEKGAFTGATALRIGRFEVADGATLFLDEIGELPLDVQAKLLRVLEDGEFERVGSSKTISVDVRIIAATNRKLQQEVQAGRFRDDLFYRLNVYTLSLPPLRERRNDIPQLVRFFVSRFNKKLGKTIDTIPQKTLDRLQAYDWPGNIRELQNVIEKAVILSRNRTLCVELPASPTPSPVADCAKTLDEVERDYIRKVLESKEWRIDGPQGAALVLGLKPSTLRYRMKKLGITRPV